MLVQNGESARADSIRSRNSIHFKVRKFSSGDVINNTPRAATIAVVNQEFPPVVSRILVTERVYENEFTIIDDNAEILPVVMIRVSDPDADNPALRSEARKE